MKRNRNLTTLVMETNPLEMSPMLFARNTKRCWTNVMSAMFIIYDIKRQFSSTFPNSSRTLLKTNFGFKPHYKFMTETPKLCGRFLKRDVSTCEQFQTF